MKKRWFLLAGLLVLGTLSTAFANYIVENLVINGVEDDVNVGFTDDKTNYKKVVFRNSTNTADEKVLYVKNNETISCEEVPFLYEDNGYYTWRANEDGSAYFNPTEGDNALTKTINVTQNLTFVPTLNTVSTPSGNSFSGSVGTINSQDTGRVTISGNGNTYYFEENNVNLESGNNSSSVGAEVVLDKGFYNDVNLSFQFRTERENETYLSHFSNGSILAWEETYRESYRKYQANGDTTIGLEDPTSVGKNDQVTFKPNSNTSSSKNYCISRVILGKDTIISNTSVLSIGALTSFYGGLDNYSQYNWQGFITGPYNELDLNGHTLIVSGNSTIEAIGSITDTSSEKTGKIIMEPGSTLLTTFVVEDHAHESSAPMTYMYSGAFFSMYRAPYLNVPIIFKNGSIFKGRLMMDWGAENDNYSINTLNILGSSSTEKYLINMYGSGEDSYVFRDISYDLSLKEAVSTESVSINNILYQRISYSIFNSSIEIQMPSEDDLTVEMALSFSLNLNKGSWFIPPYFDYSLYNSVARIKNNINFYPGSSLFVDEKSKLIFDYGSEASISEVDGGALSDLNMPSQSFINYASLNFIYEFSDMASDANKYVDNSDIEGSFSSGNCSIFTGTTKFWKEMNKRHAYCTMDGAFEFVDFTNSRLPNYTNNSLKYYLGGIINIKNEYAFKNLINSENYIVLHSSGFKSGPDRLTRSRTILGVTTHGHTSYRFNLTDYYFYPLVSNGNVLMDIQNGNENKVRDNFDSVTYTFDFGRGYINAGGKYYGYFPLNNSGGYAENSLGHLLKARYSSIGEYYKGIDDLNGKYLEITYNSSSGIVNCNTFSHKTYIYYRGIFAVFNSNGTISMNRFKSNQHNVTNETKSVRFVKDNDSYYTHPVWRLS